MNQSAIQRRLTIISMWLLITLAAIYTVLGGWSVYVGAGPVSFTYPGYELRFFQVGLLILIVSLMATWFYGRGHLWPIRGLMLLLAVCVALALPGEIFDKAVPQSIWLTPLITFALLDLFWLSIVVLVTVSFVLFLHGDRIIFHNLGTAFVFMAIGIFLICARYISDRALQEAREENANAEEAKDALAQLNLSLESVVFERTQDLTRSNSDLKQALEKLQLTQTELIQANKVAALGKLVAGMAHELNTPVGNAILASSSMQAESVRLIDLLAQNQIRKADMQALANALNEASGITVHNLERIASLIDTFKQLSPERLGGEVSSFELGDLIRECVSRCQSVVTQSPIKWQVETDQTMIMYSYRDGLEKILQIVLENALQHGLASHPEGVIHISASQPDAFWTHVRIADNGHGIAESDLQRVFEPLFTGRMAGSGHGLGLHIAFNLVRTLLGGQITVSNLAEGGLLVELVLPATAPDRVR